MAAGVEAAHSTQEVDGVTVFLRGDVPAPGEVPVLYLHGVPTNSDDWLPFLARTGGIAPDLPGFGRSAKRGDFDYSIGGYDRFLERLLDHLGSERVRLVMHDWGTVGLAFAQRCPERVERLVILDGVPFLPGYRWHPIARAWRTRVLGELVMGTTTRRTARLLARLQGQLPPPGSPDLLEAAWQYFDHGTQRAILRLYRSAPSDVLAAAGAGLSGLDVPALVVWGERDPYIATSFAEAFAATLPRAELHVSPGAGHWPWLQEPAVVDRVAAFLDGGG
jgi:pimeloyl-ACP methyl ester carboxylesterase